MNVKTIIIFSVIVVLMMGVLVLTGCGKTEETGDIPPQEYEETAQIEEQTGTAGSNLPLKDDAKEAEYQIKVAMQKLFEENYGEEVADSRIYVTKIYTAEDEQEVETLKEKNLGPNEIAFEVKYELRLAEGVEDTMKYTVANGEYDKESGWIRNKTNLGILVPDGNEYKITEFGTGW